jgi:hypothetical protein
MFLAMQISWIRQVYGLLGMLGGLTESPGIEFGPNDGGALEELFECAPTDMWGSSYPPHNTRVVWWTDQKRKCFPYSP